MATGFTPSRLLAFFHFDRTRDLVTPVFGAALFWAGSVDAFHTLAADGFIPRIAAADRFIELNRFAVFLFAGAFSSPRR